MESEGFQGNRLRDVTSYADVNRAGRLPAQWRDDRQLRTRQQDTPAGHASRTRQQDNYIS